MAHPPEKRPPKIVDFDLIQVGDEAELDHLLSDKDVADFAALSGDYNPLHMDESFARKTSFRKPVVHGMLSASFISTMIGMMLPGGGALWTAQTLEFLRPAYVGDVLHVVARVKQKSPATRLLVLQITITNQHGQPCITGESTVKILELMEEEKQAAEVSVKRVLVTGGSRGIGASVARKLAGAGFEVVVNYRTAKAEADRVVADINREGGRAIAIQADLANEAEVGAMFAALVEKTGPVHTVVHCAAPELALKSFSDLDWKDVQHQLDVQLKGAFYCAKAALPAMVESESGVLVFLGSIAADHIPPSQQTAYVVTKSALTSFAKCLASEYGPRGIRVNIVAPGMTNTDRVAHLPEKAKLLARMQSPLRRIADPGDIAEVVAFLVSPAARHITGETIRVCGGSIMV